MNIKKIILVSISYLVLMLAIAYPWHMIWFLDLYAGMGAYTRPEPSVPLGMLAIIAQGIVIAYLYPYYYKGGNPILQGTSLVL